MKDIKAVIFDWGGVLIENPAEGLMRYFSAALGVEEDEYTAIHLKYFRDFMRSSINECQFWEKVCAELDVNKPDEDFLWSRAFESVYQPREPMFELVTSLKRAGYKTALLSNTEMPCVEFFHRQEYTMFDVTVFSCIEGVKKPQRRIYEIALARLGCEPREAVMIDDIARCVQGARAVGINAIHFQSVEQVKEELSRMAIQ